MNDPQIINITEPNLIGRIDKILPTLITASTRSQIQKRIDNGNILVNSKMVKSNYKLRLNDKIEIKAVEPQTLSIEPENIPLDIIFEDDDVLVVNKPQGMVVHPAAGHANHTLVNALLFHTPLSTINGEFRPGIVHRIDKDTSGLLMVAKNDMAHQSLAQQLKDKTNTREYWAIVHGQIREDEGTIDAPLGRNPQNRQKQAIVKDGRNAITHFKVLKRYERYTLISCRLETGRTHQIRVHMQYINHPVAGDPLYGPHKTLPGKGQYLHAKTLGFEHPRTHEQLLFDAPLPTYFSKMIKYLDENDS